MLCILIRIASSRQLNEYAQHDMPEQLVLLTLNLVSAKKILKFFPVWFCVKREPQGKAIFDPIAIIWTILVEARLGGGGVVWPQCYNLNNLGRGPGGGGGGGGGGRGGCRWPFASGEEDF